ncbi:uncharacterized protein LY89DRAFT_574809 [Mollisia scopiformis]|uniref:gamma-glutamylcyclotransferase n=1 Tax=Mollisia scopiformis TaxID=149040 RepID=A0A194XR78_MOLSC|nr:uncharacterized protein LY89DRAFT_574809 [Mollisia scopiformis]KUJ22656.1 hypothetical protein LY89DRAFT_574809 [Mollisia scopiformis]
MATQQSSSSVCRGQRTLGALRHLWRLSQLTQSPSSPPPLPQTTPERLASTSEKTILYLAYGSNLSAETFKGARGIKPISSVNVHVPSLDLTFDLAGIPYIEPCFANTRWRDQNAPPSDDDYHKDRWHKGLIGVVYEVTPEDYRIIIATEGGGASYQDVVVPCYAIPPGTSEVDPLPSGSPFKAHTLLQPTDDESNRIRTRAGRIHRPDPSYAQASARYLKLITDGAEEHSLPEEYLHYLHNIRPYTITTRRQHLGQAFIVGFWSPLILALFGLGKLFADDEGKIPAWLASIMGTVFTIMWMSYDKLLKPAFGDGERTMGDDDEEKCRTVKWCEKSVVLE